MQTNKEFLDALDIRPEDGFIAVAVRRAAAWQLGKPVVELETDTHHLPDFIVPWAPKEFAWQLEKGLDIKIPVDDDEYRNKLIPIPQDWFRGPAIKMPMGEWTKIAVEQFLGPIRDEIRCPENWTPFESETPFSQDSHLGLKEYIATRLAVLWFIVLPIGILLFSFFSVPNWFFKDWPSKLTDLIVFSTVILCWFIPIILFLIWHKILNRNRKKSALNVTPTAILLGTLTFQNDKLYFFDGEMREGEIEILPGDYRCFLIYGTEDFDWPSYAVMTNGTEIPSFDTVLDIITESEDGTERQKTEVVVDSGMISLADVADSKQLPWKSRSDSKTVKEVLLREDGSVGGLKLYPSYGDGGYRAYVRKDCFHCDIVLELIAPEE